MSDTQRSITLPLRDAKSMVPKNIWERNARKINMFISVFQDAFYQQEVKSGIIKGYRKFISKKSGVKPLEVNSLTDWNTLELKLVNPTSNAGQVSHLELLSIVGLAKQFLRPGQNFLEIGTFDGNTALNVEQIYHDSTTFDFSKLSFHGAFIDGGHDYETVKSDTLNVLKYIQRPGIIFWHDYDVECEIGDLLHALAKDYPIQWIEGTRLAFLKFD